MGNEKEILNQLIRLNENLSNLASENGGIVIHDTYANVSTWINLGTNLVTTVIGATFGAIIGGYITIILFKKQEKMRIKQELRLEFYKGYKLLYKIFSDNITILKASLWNIKLASKLQDPIFQLKTYDLDSSTKGLKHCNGKSFLDSSIDAIKKVDEYINEIDDYIETNKIILNDYNGELYYHVSANVNLMKWKICKLEEYHKMIDNVYLMEYTVEELMAKYDETVQYIIGCADEIEKIIEDAKNIHSNLECEFLNQYFLKK